MSSHVIRDRIWESRKLAECSRGAALAYPWIFLVADDWGRFEFNPRRIWSKVFGAREDISVDEVAAWLQEYEDRDLLVRYHIDGELAFWTGFQGRSPSDRRKSLYPDPKDFPKKIKRRNTDRRPPADCQGIARDLPADVGASPSENLQQSVSDLDQIRSDQIGEQTTETALALPDALPASPADRVFQYWRDSTGRRDSKFTPKRRRAVVGRLREYSEQQLYRAIDGNKASPWHQGENDRHRVYDDLELICRDGEHVEQFLREHVPKPKITDNPNVQAFLAGAAGGEP